MNQKGSFENNLAVNHLNLLNEWDYSKTPVLPYKILRGSAKIVWWKCFAGHAWKAAVKDRTIKESKSCPECNKSKLR